MYVTRAKWVMSISSSALIIAEECILNEDWIISFRDMVIGCLLVQIATIIFKIMKLHLQTMRATAQRISSIGVFGL